MKAKCVIGTLVVMRREWRDETSTTFKMSYAAVLLNFHFPTSGIPHLLNTPVTNIPLNFIRL